jgi:transposase
VGARIVQTLANDIVRLDAIINEVEQQLATALHHHQHANILLSVPGFGPLLTAEFIAATGGSITHYDSPDRLAGVAGLAPAPRDSGRITGNHHRPKRYDRRLLRACYLAAQTAAIYCPISKTYYQRKRREGKSHKQAVIALARRRINVIWALLRNNTMFTAEPTAPPTTG